MTTTLMDVPETSFFEVPFAATTVITSVYPTRELSWREVTATVSEEEEALSMRGGGRGERRGRTIGSFRPAVRDDELDPTAFDSRREDAQPISSVAVPFLRDGRVLARDSVPGR